MDPQAAHAMQQQLAQVTEQLGQLRQENQLLQQNLVAAQNAQQVAEQHAAAAQQQAATAQQQAAAVQQQAVAVAAPNVQQQQQQPPQPRVKVPKPPRFNGWERESVPNWCHQMSTFLEASGISLGSETAVKTAAGYFSGPALTWWRSRLALAQQDSSTAITSWTALETAIRSQFITVSTERTARNRLQTLRQRRSVRQYAHEFNVCMIELPDMDEQDKIYRFLSGLKPEVRLHVEMAQPASLVAAVESATKVDSLLWQAKRPGPGVFMAGPSRRGNNYAAGSGPQPMELGALLSRGGNADNRDRNFRKPADLSKIKCYHCNRFGHKKAQCPQLRNQGHPNGKPKQGRPN